MVASLATMCTAADWSQFRGPDGSSIAKDTGYPTSLTDQNSLAWKQPLPGGGVAGPIVVDGRVIVTSSGGYKQDRLYVSAFDAKSGAPRWERQFWATGRTLCHPTSSVAAPTPASDGKRIFAFYSSNDLACLDLDGNLLWYRGLGHDFPAAANDVGMSSSPVVVDDTVVVQVECQGDSFVAGINAENGETRWQIERPKSANWASPVVWRDANQQDSLVLLQTGNELSAVEPRTGTARWKVSRAVSTIPSTVTVDNLLFVPGDGLFVLRASHAPGTPEEVWQSQRLSLTSSSPVVQNNQLFIINRAGVLQSVNSADGTDIAKLRLKGTFWATPVLADNHLYVVNQDGLAQVIALGDKLEIVSERELGEEVLGSPAAADGALYFRSKGHLWKFAK
jgi:outer membrane protein assembly factor BamB